MAQRFPISRETTVACSRHQISCTLSGESVILQIKDGVYYGLNEVGAVVWSALQQPKRVAELHDAVMQSFDVTSSECERDVDELLSKLTDAGLIEVVIETPA